ncbi:MAG: hypothetical protein ACLSBH_22350 [Coprobacillus cateniformis]
MGHFLAAKSLWRLLWSVSIGFGPKI